jgi:uncharacterized caspase-like protein
MKRLSILVLVLALSLAVTLSAQQKFALVIGNGGYSGNQGLNNPVNDAGDMKTALEALGFQVTLLTNASLTQMESGISGLRARLAGSNSAYGFFFYAGHGVQYRGENYLIPVGASIPAETYLKERAMNVQVILDELQAAGNGLNVT